MTVPSLQVTTVLPLLWQTPLAPLPVLVAVLGALPLRALTARQQEFSITLRAGMVIGPLLEGPSRPLVVSTRKCVLVRVLVDRGMRIVTRLLLKLVPKVA